MQIAQRRSKGHRDTYLSDWILVRVQPGRERWAMTNVRRAGGLPFLPQIQWEGRPKVEMMFPGYMFVQLTAGQWYYLRSLPGVSSIVMVGSSPAFVPIDVMARLLRSGDEEGITVIPFERFEPGQRVKIHVGTFREQVGVFVCTTGQQRVKVLLSMLGGHYEFEFGAREISGLSAESLTKAQRKACATADAPPKTAPKTKKRS